MQFERREMTKTIYRTVHLREPLSPLPKRELICVCTLHPRLLPLLPFFRSLLNQPLLLNLTILYQYLCHPVIARPPFALEYTSHCLRTDFEFVSENRGGERQGVVRMKCAQTVHGFARKFPWRVPSIGIELLDFGPVREVFVSNRRTNHVWRRSGGLIKFTRGGCFREGSEDS